MFADRQQAGHRLGKKLLRYKDAHPIILALPRGGVPVAVEIGRLLAAPVDVLCVRKIGAPWQRDLAIGAVVGGAAPQVVLNEDLIAATHVPQDYIDREAARQLADIDRRRKLYAGERRPLSLSGRTVVLVDDGADTGSTMRAAVQGVRRCGASDVVLALPVAGSDTLALLGAVADDVVCLESPDQMEEIAAYYRDRHQVHDSDLAALLTQARMAGR